MDGVVDYLSPATHSVTLLRSSKWKCRFCRIDTTFHALEVFTDASLQDRKHRVTLAHANVVTIDELGALLGAATDAKGGKKAALANSRRCVLRVTERVDSSQQLQHHYLCCEVPVDNSASEHGAVATVDMQASRRYMQQWLEALKRAASNATAAASAASSLSTDSSPGVDPRELACRIAAYSDHLHLAAFVSRREFDEHKHSVFELTVKAWILQRELAGGAGASKSDSDAGVKATRCRLPTSPITTTTATTASSSAWEVVEYACVWTIRKTTAELRDVDAQLRQFCQRELRDVAFPSSSSSSLSPFKAVGDAMHHLLHSAAHAQAENERRVAAMNSYVQQLLCLPALSAFGSDASAMLDHFLDITAHLKPLRAIEKASGQSMHLRQRRVVPWRERETFEQLYQQHLEAAAATVAQRMRAAPSPEKAAARRANKDTSNRNTKDKSETEQRPRRHRHEHRERRDGHTSHKEHRDGHKEHNERGERRERQSDSSSSTDTSQTQVVQPVTTTVHIAVDSASASPAPDAVRAPSLVEDASLPSHDDAVHARIAKIGRKLITEAFQVPSPHYAE